MLVDLLPIAAECHPHLLVCEQAELAGPIAAARLGVPNVTHAFGRLLPAARVRAALERAVGDTAFRTAAQRAQAEISAMPSPDAVVAELERRYAA
jgi:UDP:flavonoid glycosyltransferase YjiC (YdhE family)